MCCIYVHAYTLILFMYVRMYVCMTVCMYVCMCELYVCMHACMHVYWFSSLSFIHQLFTHQLPTAIIEFSSKVRMRKVLARHASFTI